jgi:hypothetical protein
LREAITSSRVGFLFTFISISYGETTAYISPSAYIQGIIYTSGLQNKTGFRYYATTFSASLAAIFPPKKARVSACAPSSPLWSGTGSFAYRNEILVHCSNQNEQTDHPREMIVIVDMRDPHLKGRRIDGIYTFLSILLVDENIVIDQDVIGDPPLAAPQLSSKQYSKVLHTIYPFSILGRASTRLPPSH